MSEPRFRATIWKWAVLVIALAWFAASQFLEPGSNSYELVWLIRQLFYIGLLLVALAFVAVVLSKIRKTQLISLEAAISLAVMISVAQFGSAQLLEDVFKFGVFTSNEQTFRVLSGWAARGIFLDFIESFDLAVIEAEAGSSVLAFNTIEFLFRTIWASWFAYLVYVSISKLRSGRKVD